jgi:transketolase
VETIEAIEIAMLSKSTPSVIALSRQKVKECTMARSENMVSKGAYFAFKNEGAEIALYGTGSEVSLCFEVKKLLEEKGVKASVVSIPCLEIFEEQSTKYKDEILNFKKRIFIEFGILGCLAKYKRDGDLFFGVETFGESGKAEDVLKHFGLEAKSIVENI